MVEKHVEAEEIQETKREESETVEESHAGHGLGGHGHDSHGPAHPPKGGKAAGKPAPKQMASKKSPNVLELIVDPLIAYIRASTVKTSRFVTYAIGLFFLGTLFGFFLPQVAERLGISVIILLVIPLALAILAFLPAFTDMIVIVFILLLVTLLLSFL